MEFLGAAQTVTGSKHLVRTSRATILLDCGLFQGHRQDARTRNLTLGFDPGEVDAVVLSHAHIDHSGALPLLVKQGYRGPIYATPATRDLCAVMLLDAAMIQEADARYINKLIARGQSNMDPVTPLYTTADAERVLEQMVCVPYHREQRVAPGALLTFLDAGHVLGSAISVLDLDEGRRRHRLAFTGDLGRHDPPLLRNAEVPSGVDTLLMESTYGDRLHAPIEEMDGALEKVLKRTFERGGKVLIPSFALERAQEIIHTLARLRREHHMPPIPIYVDSPLTVKITDVFRLHPECLQPGLGPGHLHADPAFDFERLRYIEDVEASKALDAEPGSAVIIAASGMCEGGRVLHHLKAMVENDRNTIVIVGFQAQHTLGRRLVERRRRVRIFGVERDLSAEVVVLDGFSAHADQADLLTFAQRCRDRGPIERVVLVHGEPPAQRELSRELARSGFRDVRSPAPGERIVWGERLPTDVTP